MTPAFALASCVSLLLFCGPVPAQDDSGNCLYSFHVGAGNSTKPVVACGFEDPRRIGDDARIKKTMEALGIPQSIVTFRGCAGLDFSAASDTRVGASKNQYVVSYPSDLQSPMNAMVAPIVHELAHVGQMRAAGGVENLRRMYESRRVELGADFVAGLLYATALQGTDIKDFLLNLRLIGGYLARDVESHGTPEQRTGAFRRGAFLQYPYNELSIPKSEKYFQENDYADLLVF